MGGCIYTPGQKNAYIPVNHVDGNRKLLPEQLTEEQIKEQFDRLHDTKIIMHNGKFDYEVIKCTCNCVLDIYWDTLIAAKVLDENELAGLKEQYRTKIDASQEKYDIEHLFDKMEYAIFDPEVFALYAATDAYMTYKLYEWQVNQFKLPDNQKLYSLFRNVEMPVIQVAAEMELTGTCIDKDYAQRLSDKYHGELDKLNAIIDEELEKYSEVIAQWRLTEAANYHPPKKTGEGVAKSKSEQLSTPPQLTSPTQLAILFYDVLDVGVQDKKSPRGTGEDIMLKLQDKYPLCKLILQKRGLEKLIGTYVDKLPQCVCEKDGRLHAHFNQYGAATGRFSSSEPNLQNIPSHRKDIRLMFSAAPGCVFVGSDYSQQEPRLLSMYSQDPEMIGAYKAGKDLYATIASGVYKNGYWDNMEHHEDGSPNPEGKKRRSNCKAVLLGIMYGRGASSIAEQLGCSTQEAQNIVDNFFKGFPGVKKWIDKTEADAKVNGYVEDLWGRRRRLPDIQLPDYTIKYVGQSTKFNPLLGSTGVVNNDAEKLVEKYRKAIGNGVDKRTYVKIRDEAATQNVKVIDNGAFISQAQRQCVNARVQGGAASMSKIAMAKVFHDPILRELGFRIVFQIHDEIIGECPEENAEAAAERLCEVMKTAVKDVVTVPFKCDPSIVHAWYEDDYGDTVKEKFDKYCKDMSREIALNKILSEYPECTEERMKTFVEY